MKYWGDILGVPKGFGRRWGVSGKGVVAGFGYKISAGSTGDCGWGNLGQVWS